MYCIVRLNTSEMNHQYAADIGVRAVRQAQTNKYVGAQCFTPSVSTKLMQVLQYETLLCLNGSPQQLFWASQPRPTQGLLSDDDHTTPVIQLHFWHQH